MNLSYLSVLDVKCSRNNQALFSKIDFTLHPGEVLHIRGENGIGKTTLLRCLAGLSRPHYGKIRWQGEDIFNNDEYKKQRFFLGHKNAIKLSLTVYENLLFCASLQEKPPNSLILIALEQVGLALKATQMASELSSGQKQRLALSKLLLSNAKIWILDEPFTALDSEGCQIVETLMSKHLKEQGIIVFTSHHALTCTLGGYSSLRLISNTERG